MKFMIIRFNTNKKGCLEKVGTKERVYSHLCVSFKTNSMKIINLTQQFAVVNGI